MTTLDDFWGRVQNAAPGMLDLGLGIYSRNDAQSEAKKRLAGVQGPLYQQAMAGSQTALSRAGSMDPKAAAQERFNAAQGLLAGKDAKTEADLMRMLHAKGMLGTANYNPGVEGIDPSTVAMNPHMAAYYAGRGARDANLAYKSLGEGEEQIDRMLNRSGVLQNQAANTQNAGITADRRIPSRSAATAELLKGFGGVLKDSGMLGMGTDWLKKTIGGIGSGGWGAMNSIDWGDFL